MVVFAPLSVFATVVAPRTPQFEMHPAARSSTKSPVWLSLTLNSATATPERLVLTAVTTVPEVFALPLVIEEFPPVLKEVELSPVTVV